MSDAPLAHLSDLHFGAHDPKACAALVDTLEQAAPQVIVIAGDVTQRGRRREFRALADFLSKLSAPVVMAPGNHDTPLLNLYSRSIAPFRRFRRYTNGLAQSDFRSEDVTVATVNTARGMQLRLDWSLGVANPKAVDAALGVLAESEGSALRVVACHHPLLTPRGAPFEARTLGGSAAAERLCIAQVDLVLSGHLHIAFAEPLPYGDGHCYAVGAGTALSADRTRGEPPGFNLINADKAAVEITPMRWRHGFEPSDPIRLRRRPATNGTA